MLHWCQYIIATSLFYKVNGHCFKFPTCHKNISPSMPTWLVNAFFIRINPWKFGEKQFKIDKVNVCWNHVLFILFRSSYFQQMLNIFVNFDFLFLFTKLSGIDPCEKCTNILGGHAWRHFLWLLANLKQWPFT